MQKLKQQQLFDRVFDRLPDHVTLLLIIISGFLLARLTWMMFPSDPSITARVEQEQNESAGVAVIPAHATSKNLGNEIASYHLLGVYQPPKAAPPPPKPVKKAAAPKPKPKPREPLSLVGVYALNAKEGVAVINVKGKQEVVGVGETVSDTAATLQKVYANRVDVVWDDGEVATLEMPNIDRSALGAIQVPPEQQLQQEPDPVIQPTSFEQPAGRSIDQSTQPSALNQQQEPAVADPQLQGGLPAQQRQQQIAVSAGIAPAAARTAKRPKQAGAAVSLGDFKQEIINNNINLLQVIRPSPRRENGRLIGFAVRPGTNRALFNQTGLRSGDVVTEINGMALTSNRVSRQAMQGLTTASSATLTVLRGGEPTTVQLSF